MKTLIQNEPVITAAAVTTLIGAIIGVLIAFGVPVTGDQAEAILNLAAILTPMVFGIVGAAIARSKVSPVRKDLPTHARD